MHSFQKPKTLFKPGTNRPAVILQGRDRAVLAEFETLKAADIPQIQVVGRFGSVTRTRSRCQRLKDGGFLRSLYIGTIAAGKKVIYYLSRRGAAAVGVNAPAISYPEGRLVTADQFISHQLHINDVYLSCKFRVLPEGVRFVRWRSFREPLSAAVPLIPDGYCELDSPAGIRCLFLEVDLGTEALRIWQEKIQRYLQLAISGDFTKLSGQPQFRVLVVVNSMRRLLHIREAVAAATDKIFWFAAIGDIQREGLWAPIWLRPVGDALLTLI